MWDVTQSLDSSGLQLEKQAQSQFGAAVADFNTQGKLTSSLNNGRDTSAESSNVQAGPSQSSNVWQSTKYAEDMISVAPKHRFLFKVHFHFNAPYVGDRDQGIFSFLVKNIQKPKVTYEYQKVNMYNFRTEILINIKHEPLTIDFHDDIGNYVHEFFNAYRRAYSPISRTRSPATAPQFEGTGMDFAFPDPASVVGGDYSGSSGQLANSVKNVLNYIEIEQYFGHGTRKNVFKFINPRIENFDFDEASHEAQELHSLKVSFNYDALIIDSEAVSGPTKGVYGTHDILGEGPLQQFGAQSMSNFAKSPGSIQSAVDLGSRSVVPGVASGNSRNTMTGSSDWVVQNALTLPASQQTSFIKSNLPSNLNNANGNAQISQISNLVQGQLNGPLNSALGKLPSGSTPALAAVMNPVTSFARNQAAKTLLGVSQNVGSQAFGGLSKGIGSIFGASKGPGSSSSAGFSSSVQADVNSYNAGFDSSTIDSSVDTSFTDGLA